MSMALDYNRLQHMLEEPFPALSADTLHRRDTVFFIGGNLPVYETLETMYESYCLESTDLFHVMFAGRKDLERNLELVRQIKKNFNVHLMGRMDFDIPTALVEMAYLAGLDLLDIPRTIPRNVAGGEDVREIFSRSAVEIFPRWSIVSSLGLGLFTADEMRDAIDRLLAIGIVPLPAMVNSTVSLKTDEVAATFDYLKSAWQRHEIPLRPLLPLVRLMTPLEISAPVGYIRTVINRLQDRHVLATSDLRRHLRTSGAEASFESAGL
jgi:hypothetical protein